MKLNKIQSVYVIYNPELNITKIGIASNVKERLSNLSCSAGCDMELKYNTVPIANAPTIEQMSHNKFNEHRKKGEWFKIDPQDAIRYLESIENCFIEDHIISDLQRNESISSLAKRYNVSRQAIMRRVKKFNYHSTSNNKEKKQSEMNIVGFISDITKYRRIGKNKYKDKDGNIKYIAYINGKLCEVEAV